MPDIKTPTSMKELPLTIVTQMIALATSGFGVVVALAWNEVIKNAIETYVKPYLGKGSGVFSLLVYAVAVTVLAVLVTMQLSTVQRNLEVIQEKVKKKKSSK